MARWQLNEPHYLNTPGTEWEYNQTDRTTGRQVKKRFPVPQYFHHEDETAWTEFTTNRMGQRVDGMIVVTNGNNAKPTDIFFEGEPTPGMIPLDDEAREISGKYSWPTPDRMFTSEEGTYAMRAMDAFVETQGKVNMQLAEASSRPVAGMDQFMGAMTQIMKQNQEMIFALTGKQLGIKQEIDNEEPLPVAEVPKAGEVPSMPSSKPPSLTRRRAV